MTSLATPISEHAQTNIFDQLLIYVNLHQEAKNQAISFICFGDMVDLKILQFDWLRTFWPISQEQKFFQILDLGRNTTKNISFHYRTNSIKMKDAPKAFGDFKNKQKSV